MEDDAVVVLLLGEVDEVLRRDRRLVLEQLGCELSVIRPEAGRAIGHADSPGVGVLVSLRLMPGSVQDGRVMRK
jgi:hypothetical protein